MKLYLATKKNEILSLSQMELKNIILNKVSQAQKAKNCMFSLMCGLQTQNKCRNIIGHGSHSKGRMHRGGIGKEKENKTLNVVNVLTVEE
jgi:hypothetical protein